MNVNDKNGKPISKGDDVVVDDPKPTDMHQHSFQGQVIGMKPSEGIVLVADQDGDCWDVDADSVEVA